MASNTITSDGKISVDNLLFDNIVLENQDSKGVYTLPTAADLLVKYSINSIGKSSISSNYVWKKVVFNKCTFPTTISSADGSTVANIKYTSSSIPAVTNLYIMWNNVVQPTETQPVNGSFFVFSDFQ
jgi:hypothetical protein